MNFKRYIRWSGLSIGAGVLAGLAAAAFLHSLDWATQFRQAHPQVIWALPVAGLFIGWLYRSYGRDVSGGNNLILEEIHDPRNVLPVRMAPLILLGTVITHLFGGSAGREGTAVQMGASLSDQLAKIFPVEPEERKILLIAGAGAGFGAAIGAPWAGMIFGMEVIWIGRLRLFAWFECFVASFTATAVTWMLKAPHSQYPRIEIPGWDWQIFFFVALAGVAFGLTALLFSKLTHAVEKVLHRLIANPMWKPFVMGMILVALYHLEGSYRYVGLGIEWIQSALQAPVTFQEPMLKMFFTSLTVGSGFKGGEFIPLVFMGTTLGSALSIILPVSFSLLAAVGFAAVFAGAANTPIACSLMAMEIFGFQIAPYALVACFVSYFCSGHSGIYKSQRIHIKKHHLLLKIGSFLARSFGRRFSYKRRMYDDTIEPKTSRT
jgi:H+/Cl- antiporter ClcA